MRHSEGARLRNRQQRSNLRSSVKKFRELMEGEPSQQDADAQFASVAKSLDQAAAKNLIHSNVASRTKSRLAALKKRVCAGA